MAARGWASGLGRVRREAGLGMGGTRTEVGSPEASLEERGAAGGAEGKAHIWKDLQPQDQGRGQGGVGGAQKLGVSGGSSALRVVSPCPLGELLVSAPGLVLSS